MAENDFEKTEAPTPRRLEEARQEGNVARSADLTAACTLLGGVLLLYLLGGRMMSRMGTMLETMLSSGLGQNPTRHDDLAAVPAFLGRILAESLVPIMLGTILVALVATLCQVGFLFSVRPLEPKLSRLSPLRGVLNMVNARAGIRLLMSLAKVFVIGSVAGLLIWLDLDRVMLLSHLQPFPMLAAASQLIFALALKLAAVLIVLAILDYALQRWQRIRDLKMTKTEVKDEMKRMDGDPLIKQRRTRIARQLALQRIGQDVPHADVVVTNPTHYAVALRYDAKMMRAPKVAAKGADFMAMRIRQIAMTHGVPLVERKELARGLYRSVEVGQEVPPQFYAAVAEILAYVYRLGGRRSA